MKISIARDFSDVPVGRGKNDGPFSGQYFREDFLVPKLNKASEVSPLEIDINDAEGYPSSFLEEAFGGLVRKSKFKLKELQQIMTIIASEEYKIDKDLIWKYIKEAEEAEE